MADLSSASTGAGGLGTTAARWALISVWALGLLSDLLSGAVAPPLGSELLALPFGLVAAIVLSTRGDDALSPFRAAVVGASAGLSAIGSLASGAPLGHTWSFAFAAYMAALLLPRGNVRSGLVSGAAIAALGLAWALRFEASPAQLLDLLALPVLALVVGSVWRRLLRRIVTRELTYNREVERAAMAARIAESSTSATQAELAAIGEDVGETLRAIRDGRPLDDALLTEVAVAEASLRDRIRSPNLHHAHLSPAINRARRRGVQVVLLGGSSPESVVTDALANSIVEVVDGAQSGSMTLRAIPAGRHGAVSVLRADEHGDERLVLAADGRLLSRH